MVKINGESLAVSGKSVLEYLESADYDPKRVAVECNGRIVPRAQYAEWILQDEDCLEVVSFVGGG